MHTIIHVLMILLGLLCLAVGLPNLLKVPSRLGPIFTTGVGGALVVVGVLHLFSF